MPPTVGRLAFSMGFTIFLLALVTLPFLDPGSAEFVVDLIALGLSAVFVGLIVWSVRRAASLPNRSFNCTQDDNRPDDAPLAAQQPNDNLPDSKQNA
jgi:hypothetical protein